jgi:transcription termination factor Rho
MAAEPQLERSVLERKERDELRAIAQAMALETNTRSKKADIIDQILHAAGVTAGAGGSSNGDGPARARARRAAGGEEAGTAAVSTAEPPAAGPSGPAGDGGSPPESSPNGSSGSHAAATAAAGGPTTEAPAERPAGAPQRQGSQNRPGPGGGNEPGNRRSRRRRGRERSGGERELQGGGQEAQYAGELVPVHGLLDLRDEGFGFLRAEGYLPSPRDVYVSISQARRFALRKGDYVEGACRPAASNEKFPALIRIDSVCGLDPEQARSRPRFEDLTPLFPDSKLRLETTGAAEVTTRIIDLLSPIGKGQRGLIVSPPKAGKTTVLKQIAHSIETNNPEVHLIVLLVDERPEEVTDMRRSVKGEVVASTFDRPSDEHTSIAELTIDRAKRLVELGRDVVIVLDGITRLARAYNLAQPASGRIMSGGVDSGALYPPKKFFGAARNVEEGGSLTILATALVETGSKMDEVIFEEFKGTGNMELRLDRRLAERRLYPAIDVNASSTRHEELLFERGQLQQVWKLRRVLNALAADGNAAAGVELLMDKIRTTKGNDEFLAEIAKGPAV